MQVTHPQSQAIIDVDVLNDFELNEETGLLELTESFKRRIKAEYKIEMDDMFLAVIIEELNKEVLKYLDIFVNELAFNPKDLESKDTLEISICTRVPFAPMPEVAMEVVLDTIVFADEM